MNSTLIIKTTQALNSTNVKDLLNIIEWQDTAMRLKSGSYYYELSSGYIYVLEVNLNEITVNFIH